MKFEDRQIVDFRTFRDEDGSLKVALFVEDEAFPDRGRAYGLKLTKECQTVKHLAAVFNAFSRRLNRQSNKFDGCDITPFGEEEIVPL